MNSDNGFSLDVNSVPDVNLLPFFFDLGFINRDHMPSGFYWLEKTIAFRVPFSQCLMGERFKFSDDFAGFPIGETSMIDKYC